MRGRIVSSFGDCAGPAVFLGSRTRPLDGGFEVRHCLNPSISGIAGRCSHSRRGRQRHRRRDRGQCCHGRRPALRQWYRWRSLHGLLRGQNGESLWPELKRMDSQGAHHRFPQSQRRHGDQPYRRRDHRRARRCRRMGCDAYAVRVFALQPTARSGHLLCAEWISAGGTQCPLLDRQKAHGPTRVEGNLRHLAECSATGGSVQKSCTGKLSPANRRAWAGTPITTGP